MTQISLQECIIKHVKVVYAYYIAAIAAILFIIGVAFAYGSIEDTLVSTLTLAVTRVIYATTIISTYIASITSIIPTLAYLIGMLIFGPLILILIYCVWLQLPTKKAKIIFSIAGVLFTTSFITQIFLTLVQTQKSASSLSIYEEYLMAIMVIFYFVMLFYFFMLFICAGMLGFNSNEGECK